MHYLGIDIGGTKTSVSVGDEAGKLLLSERIPSEVEKGPDDWFQRLEKLIHSVLASWGQGFDEIQSVGVSAPGPLSVESGLLLDPPNMTGWINVPVVERIQSMTGRPVVLNNDANAAVLAEFLFGSFKGTQHMIYLTLSTGLGAGIITGGRVLQGASDLGGEVGFHVLDLNGPESPCGHRGSFEAFCGGKNFAERLKRAGASASILAHAGGDLDAIDFKAFLAAVRDGDPFALEAWDGWCLRLAQGIGNLVMILNPEVVLLGTIGIYAADLLLPRLNDLVPDMVHASSWASVTLAPATLGKGIGDYAALALAVERELT